MLLFSLLFLKLLIQFQSFNQKVEQKIISRFKNNVEDVWQDKKNSLKCISSSFNLKSYERAFVFKFRVFWQFVFVHSL